MKNQTNKTEEKTYTSGEVGSMLESIDSTMKLLSENYVSIDGRLGRVEARLDTVDVKLEKIETRLDGVEIRLDRVETKVDRLQDDMVEVKYELKNKVDRGEFERLEKRVVKLERTAFLH